MSTGPDTLLSEGDCAALLHTSRRSLQRWRQQGTGPPWIRVGKRVLYRREAVLKWLEDKEKGGHEGPP